MKSNKKLTKFFDLLSRFKEGTIDNCSKMIQNGF